jgi:hypothetical protein
MPSRRQRHVRHTAAEWARLVRAWKRSGLTATEFAASVAVAPRMLKWWTWHHARRATASLAPTDQVQLVQVDVERPGSEAAPAWELVTDRGLTLRMHRSLPPAEVATVVDAFVAAVVRL